MSSNTLLPNNKSKVIVVGSIQWKNPLENDSSKKWDPMKKCFVKKSDKNYSNAVWITPVYYFF